METKHFPPLGQSLIGTHVTSAECACSPEKQVIRKRQSSGRGGSGQGYKIVSVNYMHNKL